MVTDKSSKHYSEKTMLNFQERILWMLFTVLERHLNIIININKYIFLADMHLINSGSKQLGMY